MFWLLFLVLPLASIVVFGLYVILRRRNLGSLAISTSSVAYNHDQFGHILTWDKHTLYLHSEPLIIQSGEFHYWRVPDQSRWRTILMQYKSAGLNCIRIYFHWGFHSSREGNYDFSGNRDLEYLLTLCEELRLFVLAAPGPYICAETQGGGIPPWVISKRHVRIRHALFSFFRSYDEEYSRYCQEWLRNICPILARHQVTDKKNGCLLAFQIENESFELFKGIPIGLADDMRVLAKTSRDCGINVPLFTNDGWEEGSFVARPDSHTVFGKQTFGLDIYGFDKYVVFCPTSSPLSAVTLGGSDTKSWPEWNVNDVINSLSKTESTVRKFGGGAASSPIFIPELQGGWFNHYTVKHTYDDVYRYFPYHYSFYGKDYTRMIYETCLSQGITAMNIYMFYGGTNVGTLGDPDVYTSYDYSACIREFGHFSDRGRKLRLAISFTHSFSRQLSRTIPECEVSKPSFVIKSSLDQFISARRTQVGPAPMEFIFFRNFNSNKNISSTISVIREGKEEVQMICRLQYKSSFIGIGNYTPASGPRIILSTLPIHVRTKILNGEELMIIQSDEVSGGQIAFQGSINATGTLEPLCRKDADVSILSFQKSTGYCLVSVNGERPLHLISLTGKDLLTLNPVLESKHWDNSISADGFIAIFWGCYATHFNTAEKILQVQQHEIKSTVYCITSSSPASFVDTDIEFVRKHSITADDVLDAPIEMKLLGKRVIDFERLQWHDIAVDKSGTTPLLNPIDLCYTSGHVVYKMSFEVSRVSSQLVLDLNMRHRALAILNGNILGGNIVYSLGILRAGAKNGNDIGLFGGWCKYNLPMDMVHKGSNTLHIIVESLGLNRQPFALNDVRNDRGILKATIPGVILTNWQISGVDVRTLHNSFNHSGFSDEQEPLIPINDSEKGRIVNLEVIQPCWFQLGFEANKSAKPLRLCISGKATCYVFLNDTMIARYYGNGDGPQHDFLLQHGLLGIQNTLRVLAYAQDACSSLSFEIKAWMVANMLGSGNLDESGQEFKLFTSTFKF